MSTGSVTVGLKPPFVKKLILIEGISRTGKFLIGNLIQGIVGIEPVRYVGIIEQIPNHIRFGLMDRTLGQQLVRSEIDFQCYETVIGRFFNSRIFDKSYIGHVPDYKQLLARSREPDDQKLMRNFTQKKRYALFMLHESMLNIRFFMDLFPESQIIHMERNPIDIVYSWYQRHLLRRWGNDPLVFQIPFKDKSYSVPWFALDWSEEYVKCNQMDRVIGSIIRLQQHERQMILKLPTPMRRRVAIFHFDTVTSEPRETITRISKFLEKSQRGQILEILRREHLPSTAAGQTRKKKLEYIERRSGRQYLPLLHKAHEQYVHWMTHETQ